MHSLLSQPAQPEQLFKHLFKMVMVMARRRVTSRIGIMRTLVAVFEIHIERNMVGIMKPSMIMRGEVPKRLSTDMAILK